MTSARLAAPPSASDSSPGASFVEATLAIAEVEVRKFLRDPTELFTRALQPTLWLVVFGQVFARVKGIDTGGLGYLAFMAPGILAQSVLFSAIFYGLGVIWERDLGIVHKLLVSPASRGALVLGKALSAGVRGLAQAAVVYAIAALLGVAVRPSPGAFAGVALVVACIVKTRERFMGVGQVMTMPLFFASNAIYPLALMPGWLQALARLNPLTYLVDALRGLMVEGGASQFGLGVDVVVMAVAFGVMVAVAAKLYPTIIR